MGETSGVYFMSGNHALVEGAIAAGCRFFAGYPITPASEAVERFAFRMPEVGGIYFQGEDEIASIAALLGASWGGLKAMTATSGPGFSLMLEHIGFAAMTETPCVIANIQRGGPATGLPTLPAQGDVMQAKWGSHGHYEIIALAPNSVQETFDLTIRAFNLSERFRVPVIILLDECIAHAFEKVIIPTHEKIPIFKRKTAKHGQKYLPFQPGNDMIPAFAEVGEGFKFHITGLTHDERGYPAVNPDIQQKLIKRLCDKIRKNADEIADVELEKMGDADVAVISYGSPSRSVQEAVIAARKIGIKAGSVRLRTIWPFPEKAIRSVAKKVRAFVVAEMNYGQIALEVERCSAGKRVFLAAKLGGEVHTPKEILNKIMELDQLG